MLFRNATIDDLPLIVAIYNSVIPGRMVTADTEPVTVEQRLDWFHAHHEKRPLLVGVEDDEVVGFLSYKSFYGRQAYNITAEISIYLGEKVRGRGFGKILLQKAIDLAPELGLKNLLGFIFESNVPSLRLFEKFGFERWGFLPAVAEIEGREYNLMIVGKKV